MIIVPLWRSASASASADLPLAVGPAMSATFGKGPMFIATLIAASLSKGEVSAARDRLDAAGCLPVAEAWDEQGEALDLQFGRDPRAARGTLEGQGYDVVVQPAEHRCKMLLVADMDSTMITVECLDELADYAGIKAEVAAVTEAAMRGWGATAILVSGGFTRFADPVAERIGFTRAIANRREVADGKLTGKVAKPIVDAATKLATLAEATLDLGLPREATMAVGDGANDLAMITQAGLGVAYHAKPVVASAAGARIEHGDLSALLFAQGVARKDWAKV